MSEPSINQCLDRLFHIGGGMANLCFSLSQKHCEVTPRDREIMKQLQVDWDATVRAINDKMKTTRPPEPARR